MKGTRQTPTRGYRRQAGNNQYVSLHWFTVFDYELHLPKKLRFSN